MISRFKSDGRVEMGVFLVDILCLGVKDAFFYRAETLSAYERTLEEIMQGERVAMPPAAARKLVEQAVAYAAKLGFAPAADYKKGARIFGGIHTEDWPGNFTFGKKGKPFFINGPNDTPSRCNKIIAALERSCGPGNFDYTIVSNFENIELEGVEFGEEEPEEEEDEREEKGTFDRSAERRRETDPAGLVVPAGDADLAERLAQIVDPWLSDELDPHAMETLFLLGVAAWNHSVTPWVLRLVLKMRIWMKGRRKGVAMFNELIERRHNLFPDDRRVIADLTVNQCGYAQFEVRVGRLGETDKLPERTSMQQR